MRRFLWKTILLFGVLFIGVLIGMNKANQGMMEMKGYPDPSLQMPVTINKSSDGLVQTTLLGNELSPFQLDQKQAQMEEAASFNIFSEIGKGLAAIVTGIVQAIAQFVTDLFSAA